MAGTTPHHLRSSRNVLSNNRSVDMDFNFGDELDTTGAGGDFSTHGLPDLTWDMSTNVNFTAINGAPASTSTQTVSPKDIFNDSAPPSTAFTNLTSPDINASPFGIDSYQTSPAFMTENDFNSGSNDNWFSLFPDSNNDAPIAHPVQRTTSDQSFQSTGSSGASPALGTATHRKSVTDTPPSARHSSVSGVKPRRRKGPLPEIPLNPDDKVAYKRARNTLAARESRQRKLEHVTVLQNQVADLQEEVEKWKQIALSYGHVEN